ncbi:MAG: endonuclease/exonuclease/phosphatase family protein [Bacteroidota bacterium]
MCGYLAAYVHPATAWWLQPFAIVLPYAAAIVAMLTVLTLARRWRRARLVHMLLLLLTVVRFGPGWLPPPEAPAGGDTLSVYVLNTLNGAHEASAGDTLLAQVNNHAADLLALQETWISVQSEITYAPFLEPIRADGFSVPPSVARGKTLNLPLLSKGAIAEYAQQELTYWEGSERTFAVGRGIIQLGGRAIVIYNVHLRSYGESKPWDAAEPDWLSLEFWRPYLRRVRQDYTLRARQAVRIRERMDAEEHPVILAGDFNSPTYDWVYHHLAAGMTDAFQAAGTGWGGTYHREVPFVRIDHVLLSPELTPVRAEVLGPLFSDHLPQIVEVAWTDAEDSAKTDER